MAKKKEKPLTGIPEYLKDAVAAHLDDPVLREHCPALHELVMPRYDEDGVLTYPGARITIVVDGASWKVSLDLEPIPKSAAIILDTLHDLTAQLETVIRGHALIFGDSWKKKKKDRTRLAASIQ